MRQAPKNTGRRTLRHCQLGIENQSHMGHTLWGILGHWQLYIQRAQTTSQTRGTQWDTHEQSTVHTKGTENQTGMGHTLGYPPIGSSANAETDIVRHLTIKACKTPLQRKLSGYFGNSRPQGTIVALTRGTLRTKALPEFLETTTQAFPRPEFIPEPCPCILPPYIHFFLRKPLQLATFCMLSGSYHWFNKQKTKQKIKFQL